MTTIKHHTWTCSSIRIHNSWLKLSDDVLALFPPGPKFLDSVLRSTGGARVDWLVASLSSPLFLLELEEGRGGVEDDEFVLLDALWDGL